MLHVILAVGILAAWPNEDLGLPPEAESVAEAPTPQAAWPNADLRLPGLYLVWRVSPETQKSFEDKHMNGQRCKGYWEVRNMKATTIKASQLRCVTVQDPVPAWPNG